MTRPLKIAALCLLTTFPFLPLTSTDAPLSAVKDPSALIDNQITRIDTLIQATQQSLEGEKKLRESIVEYKKIQDQFLKRPNDNDILFNMVKSASRTLKLIKEHHLEQTFDAAFIEELTVLSQTANKRGLPKP